MTTALDDLLSVETLTGLIKTFADTSENRSCSTLFSKSARQLKPDGKVGTELALHPLQKR